MEEALQRLMKESGSTKYANVASAANKALDILESYNRAPPHEYRRTTLEAVRFAFDLAGPKLIAQAIVILQKMVRDDRFHSKEKDKESEANEDQWMSSQILAAVRGTHHLTEDQKQEVLKVLLSLSCHSGWILNGHLVVKTLTFCLELYGTGGNGTKAAALATCSQAIMQYCKAMGASDEDDNRFHDAIPVFQFLTAKLDSIQRHSCDTANELSLLLQCLHTLVTNVPRDMAFNEHFKRYVCTKLCPTLIALIDSTDNQRGSHVGTANNSTSNKASGFWKRKPSGLRMNESHMKIIILTFIDSADLLGPDPEMRPVLESLFHRLLLTSQPKERLMAVHHLKEFLALHDKVLRLAVYHSTNSDPDFDPMPLFKLIADSMEDCAQTEEYPKLILESGQLISNFLASLQMLASGAGLTEQQAKQILEMFPDLDSADYNGPTYYDGLNRLPQEYTSKLEDKPPDVEDDQAEGASADDDGTDLQGKDNDESGTDVAGVRADEGTDEADQQEAGGEEKGESAESTTGDSQNIDVQVELDGHRKTAPNRESEVESAGSRVSEDDLDCSEETEGPEEGFEEDPKALKLDSYVKEADTLEHEALAFNSKRIPKTLVDRETAVKPALDHADDDDDSDNDDNEMAVCERENARLFVNSLKDQMDNLSRARGSVELDVRLQQFASDFCARYSTHSSSAREADQPRIIILNADGVYMATYSALHLSMWLTQVGFFTNKSNNISPVNKQQFLANILDSGLLVYVSPTWLSEVYDIVTEIDVFELGLSKHQPRLNTLRNLLSDLDGFGKTHRGAQLLSESKLFRQDTSKLSPSDSELLLTSAGKRIARRVLSTCWSSFLSHLMTALNAFLTYSAEPNGSRFGTFFRSSSILKKMTHSEERLAVGIECLNRAMNLCSLLELHDHCGEMLEPLTQLVCPDTHHMASGSWKKGADVRHNLTNLVYIEDVLANGLELASQSQDCWKYVMRCVTFVLRLEGHRSEKGPIPSKKTSAKAPPPKDPDELDLNFEADDENASSISSSTFALPPGFDSDEHEKGLRELFADYLIVKDRNTYLTAKEASTAVAVLLHRVERLFDDAAAKLNLRSLLGFMSELSFCSHKELLTIFPRQTLSTKLSKQQLKSTSGKSAGTRSTTLLFHRISEVMLKCVKSGRPLLHIVRAWAIVGPHLMEASCHRENIVSKKAVEYIHDIILLFLQNTSELPFFHFNEMLFKPFENLVCLELCDTDVQDQIVTSICEFVESSTSEIGSGWRSLFGTLKEVRFPLCDPSATSELHWRAVLDVFDAFLATENPQIFANAALDYISCLIRHVKGGEERQQLEELVPVDPNLDEKFLVVNGSEDLTRAALQHLLRCNEILRRMYAMAKCPVFQGAHRIRISRSLTIVVDPVIPDIEVRSFDPSSNETMKGFPYSYRSLQTNADVEDEGMNYMFHDGKSRRLLRVWYFLIDGLTSAVLNCPRQYQSCAVDTLFEILSQMQERPKVGHEGDDDGNGLLAFGLFCTNHLLLPMLQSWLRQSQRTFQGWAMHGPNFKHCVGCTAEFVMKWLEFKATMPKVGLALKQLLLILIECTVVPVEGIARLGCSCFRYILLTGGPVFDSDQWQIFCLSLCRAIQITLFPLHQLMAPFYQGSSNFYGDIGDVKVAARRDSCKQESHRLLQLAQQVLLLDRQRSELPEFPDHPHVEERSLLFLLQPPVIGGPANDQDQAQSVLTSDAVIRVPVRKLLTGITAHHLLLQIVGNMLLQGTENVIPSMANLFLHTSVLPPLTPCVERASLPGSEKSVAASGQLSGVMDQLTYDQMQMVLWSLKSSYQTALEFDCRPGLKFLVQKVSQLNNAANLYKHAGAAWSMRATALFELSVDTLRSEDMTVDKIKQVLEAQQKSKNTHQFSAAEERRIPQDDPDAEQQHEQETQATYYVELHNLFNDICEFYVDIIVDKDGHHSKLDEMSKQQLYFLTIEPDDFHEMVKRPRDAPPLHVAGSSSVKSTSASVDGAGAESPPRRSASPKPEDSALPRDEGACNGETDQDQAASPQPARPFQFSDFASQPIRPESPNVSEDLDICFERDGNPGHDSMTTDPDVEANDPADEEVFRVATQDDMDSMMSSYRYNKGKHTLPSSTSSLPKDTPPPSATLGPSADNPRKNPFLSRPRPDALKPTDDADPEIVSQQKASLMADSEAQEAVWTELVLVLFHLSASLNDDMFTKFLPLLFPGVRTLTAYARAHELKQQIANFFQRVAAIYGFNSDCIYTAE